ncbi:hypothetical protein [Parafrankia discariae]|uniref:hypothetical protein n=1 Tax=Parafrankia discariae TaxID=365528 RepID=UPI0003684113|nr:hypothetical protein [Parafrankia discariae]
MNPTHLHLHLPLPDGRTAIHLPTTATELGTWLGNPSITSSEHLRWIGGLRPLLLAGWHITPTHSPAPTALIAVYGGTRRTVGYYDPISGPALPLTLTEYADTTTPGHPRFTPEAATRLIPIATTTPTITVPVALHPHNQITLGATTPTAAGCAWHGPTLAAAFDWDPTLAAVPEADLLTATAATTRCGACDTLTCTAAAPTLAVV